MPKITRQQKQQFLNELAATGVIRRASAASGISNRCAYKIRSADPKFREQWDDALNHALGDAELRLRDIGRGGTVVHEKFNAQGDVVARSYSAGDPRALQLYLAARLPEYRRSHVVESNVNVDAKVTEQKSNMEQLKRLDTGELKDLERLLAKASGE